MGARAAASLFAFDDIGNMDEADRNPNLLPVFGGSGGRSVVRFCASSGPSVMPQWSLCAFSSHVIVLILLPYKPFHRRVRLVSIEWDGRRPSLDLQHENCERLGLNFWQLDSQSTLYSPTETMVN